MNSMEDCVYKFLKSVDKDFPVPLSTKIELSEFAMKLCKYATLCVQKENNDIVAMVAGYTNDNIEGIGYISIVATVSQARKRGIASNLVKEYIDLAKQHGMKLVHLYTAKNNIAAIAMYKRIGFLEYKMENEPRPNDVHLAYYIGR